MTRTFNNPILPGFYPDPSLCRVGEDYYLVTSTFTYFPGVPIFHSKDLVHWEQIGNILDREEQVSLINQEHSSGIYAPTLRYYEGTFYMITTNVGHGGNFIVTATDPRGSWSNPYFLEGGGIDPSLFFDDDGKCYYTGTRERREGGKYYGDNEIWLQELDLTSMKLVGESYPIWHGALKDVVWPEGPHIYKKDGYYYLVIAEAGTAHNHAVTVARSKEITKPFTGNSGNPILTHRHLGYSYPIVNVGHGDLVETQNGQWWMVVLASRPYGGYYRNLGRETFLVPVTWEDGWPVINVGIGLIENVGIAPNLPAFPVESLASRDDFDKESLSYNWLFLKNPIKENYSFTKRKGFLSLKLTPEQITGLVSPSFVCKRQTDMSFVARTNIDFDPKSDNEVAGLVIIQSNKYNYQFVVGRKDSRLYVSLIRCENGTETLLESSFIDKGNVCLRLKADYQDLEFSYSYDDKDYIVLKDKVDGRILCSDVAGGFVGNCIGIYASSNGIDSDNYAYFDWFSYCGV